MSKYKYWRTKITKNNTDKTTVQDNFKLLNIIMFIKEMITMKMTKAQPAFKNVLLYM